MRSQGLDLRTNYPERIVCLTEETTETLYLLEEDWRIVGISGFTVRPPEARQQKPVVSSFEKGRIPEILALNPDLVLGFSDVQANIAAQLIAEGIDVHVFNHRTVAGILRMIRMLGAMIGCPAKADTLTKCLIENLESQRANSSTRRRPRVYFEEWNDPLITGIGWVSELIELAGGSDVFADLATESLAKNRVVGESDVVRRSPDIIIGSWCGKPFRPNVVRQRPGWEQVPAVQNGHIWEIDSSIILQPGPAALTDGLERLHKLITQWRDAQA